MAASFRIEGTVHGHHVYKASWSEKSCGFNSSYARPTLKYDFAIVFLKNNNTVDHIPQEISVCLHFEQ